MDKFEKFIRNLTSEINGQYPRPWMTDMSEPSRAKVFVVGYNPAGAYYTETVDYERYIDSLLNRNGENCRSFYREVTHTSPSRGNIEMFTDKLKSQGVSEIIETNVVCYGAGKKKYLSFSQNLGGKERGIEIFRALLGEIKPKAVVVHGAGVVKELNKALALKPNLPGPPKTPSEFVQSDLGNGTKIFIIPSLALPGYQNWPSSPLQSFCNWADQYLNEISKNVASACSD